MFGGLGDTLAANYASLAGLHAETTGLVVEGNIPLASWTWKAQRTAKMIVMLRFWRVTSRDAVRHYCGLNRRLPAIHPRLLGTALFSCVKTLANLQLASHEPANCDTRGLSGRKRTIPYSIPQFMAIWNR